MSEDKKEITRKKKKKKGRKKVYQQREVITMIRIERQERNWCMNTEFTKEPVAPGMLFELAVVKSYFIYLSPCE